MNIEYFRRETAKKNIGLVDLPTEEPIVIAKGLEPIDFIGMIIDTGYMIVAVQKVDRETDAENGEVWFNIADTYKYVPRTGYFSAIN